MRAAGRQSATAQEVSTSSPNQCLIQYFTPESRALARSPGNLMLSKAAPLQTAKGSPLQTAGANQILQRRCACGAGASGLTGECAACGQKKLAGLQAKFRVNEPGDAYEQEADRIAEQMLAKPVHQGVSSAPPRIQRYYGASERAHRHGPRKRRARARRSRHAARARAASGHGGALRPRLFASAGACRRRC